MQHQCHLVVRIVDNNPQKTLIGAWVIEFFLQGMKRRNESKSDLNGIVLRVYRPVRAITAFSILKLGW
jgi:hypothetical protein